MRILAVPVLVVAVLAAVVAPAAAAPPTSRTVTDRAEPGKAYDITVMTLKAATARGRKARVVVEHARRVATGDGVDVWVDTDRDRLPDLYITGYAYSEYGVFKARGWDGHGRDITDRGCATMRMIGRRSVIRFDPSCLAQSASFAVSVRSSVQDRPARTADQVPGTDRLTKRVLSYAD